MVKLQEHFSDKDINHLKRWAKDFKLRKHVLLGIGILGILFSVGHLLFAVWIAQRYDIRGLGAVLATWYQEFEPARFYRGHELLVARYVASAHLEFGAGITSLVSGALYPFRTQKALLKCWELLWANREP